MRQFRAFLAGVLLPWTLALGLGGAAEADAPQANLTIDANAQGTPVSPLLYGVFFEDINSSADGGLYAEMLQNRSFEFHRGTESWGVIKAGQDVKATIQRTGGLNATNTRYLRLVSPQPGPGISNSGYEGLVLEPGREYHFSAYLRSPDASVHSLTVSLNSEKAEVLTTLSIDGIGTEWKQFTGTLSVKTRTTGGWIGLRPDQAGTTDFDVVSLFPGQTFRDRPNGLRVDLATLVQNLGPRFMRFPGGCVIEGRTMAGAYHWKDTIGDVAARKAADNFWGYYQSFGLGFHEYFQFCEDIGAEPLPVINAGMAFQDANDVVPLSKLGPWIQDALDLVEYANGDVSTTWGALRAKNGHPAPFHLKFMALGNEQWGEPYFQHYKLIAQALKAKYPEIQLVLSSGPLDSGPIFDDAWNHVKAVPADIVDEHYYMAPEWFLANTHRYDSYDRKGPQVFLGEYAAITDGKRNNLYGALAEAAYMTGLERNGDVVKMASYAPLMAKDGATQWDPDMIRFNNETAFGTPSYYVQQMFSRALTQKTLPTTIKVDSGPAVDTSVSGGVGLGTWATQVEYKDLKVTAPGGQVLFQPSLDSLDGWTTGPGDWSARGGEVSQQSEATGCTLTYPGQDWKGITLSVKAKKKSGAEGMLILFGVDGDNYYWWNLGGWGNTQAAIEKGTAGAKSILGKGVPLSIDTNRWYDIRIELKGGVIRCFLNNKLIEEVKVPGAPETFFAHAGRTADGSIVIKAVNVTSEPRPLHVTLPGTLVLKDTAEVTVLSNPDVNIENSFQDKEKVVPKTVTISGVKADFSTVLEPYSLTILKLLPATK